MKRLLLVVLIAACGPKPAGPPYVRRHVDGDDSLPCLAWKDRRVTYRVSSSFFGANAVDASFVAWGLAAQSCSDLNLVADPASSNDIVLREQRCTPTMTGGCWDSDAATLALTTVTYSRSTGALLEADIELNGADWVFTTVDAPVCPLSMPATSCVATDVQNTVTHEIGHLLGFDHVSREGSTMSTTAPSGELTKRTIDDGTKEGICAVYPAAVASPSCKP